MTLMTHATLRPWAARHGRLWAWWTYRATPLLLLQAMLFAVATAFLTPQASTTMVTLIGLALVLPVLAMAGHVGFMLAYLALSPIERLRSGAQQVSSPW